MLRAIAIFLCLLLLQGGFWHRTHHILPDMSIVPDVPSDDTLKALSFGDEEALFRLLGLKLQNAGDTFGRFTALYKYDYERLYHWFRLLDTLDNVSNYLPSMATYYYSQSQNQSDVRYIVDYLSEHVGDRTELKWWWLVQGVYLSQHKLKDNDMALALANRLSAAQNVPLWVKQMPAFVHEQRGEFDAALGIMQNIMEHQGELKQGDFNFMYYFIQERLHRLEEVQGELEDVRQRHGLKPGGTIPDADEPPSTMSPPAGQQVQ